MSVIDDADIIELCNRALNLLGQGDIVINGSGRNYNLCLRFFPKARDEILVSHPWNDAIKRANMIETTNPLHGYNYSFTKPSDCLRVLEIDNDPLVEFRVEGSNVLANKYEAPADYDEDEVDYLAGEYISSDDSGDDLTYLVDTAFTSSDETSDLSSYCTSQGGALMYMPVRYIFQQTDVTAYKPHLEQCIVYALAIKLSAPVKANEKAALNLQQMLYGGPSVVGYLNMARSTDAQESAVTEVKTQNWLNSRY